MPPTPARSGFSVRLTHRLGPHIVALPAGTLPSVSPLQPIMQPTVPTPMVWRTTRLVQVIGAKPTLGPSFVVARRHGRLYRSRRKDTKRACERHVQCTIFDRYGNHGLARSWCAGR